MRLKRSNVYAMAPGYGALAFYHPTDGCVYRMKADGKVIKSLSYIDWAQILVITRAIHEIVIDTPPPHQPHSRSRGKEGKP